MPEISDLITDLLRHTLNVAVQDVRRIGSGGKNSRVYQVVTADDRAFAVKQYFQPPGDTRDRLGVEFGSLQFLWRHGLRCIPEPVAALPEEQFAIYGYIDGIPPAEALIDDPAMIEQAVCFVDQLTSLRENAVAEGGVVDASGASFSLDAIEEKIALRVNRLALNGPAVDATGGLLDFLNLELMPLMGHLLEDVRRQAGKDGVGWDTPLPFPERTLSPSDFGFHNALVRKTDQQVVFLDFEYFGWDDPAKLICDFLLHPAMSIAPDCRRLFLTALLRSFADVQPAVRQRCALVYPLYGLMWSLIMLNEFLPGGIARSKFLSPDESRNEAIQAQQMAKARAMLARIHREFYAPTYFLHWHDERRTPWDDC